MSQGNCHQSSSVSKRTLLLLHCLSSLEQLTCLLREVLDQESVERHSKGAYQQKCPLCEGRRQEHDEFQEQAGERLFHLEADVAHLKAEVSQLWWEKQTQDLYSDPD